MVADRTTCRSAQSAVVARHMARDAANYGSFDAAFGVCRTNVCQADR